MIHQNPVSAIRVIVVDDDDSFLDGGIAAGASGFLLKTTRPAEIAEAIRTIHAGGKVLSPGSPPAPGSPTHCDGALLSFRRTQDDPLNSSQSPNGRL